MSIPELGILGCEGRNELVDGYPMLKVPPWHQELQPVLFALAGLPLYYLQIARYSTATSCTHMNLQQFMRHYIADEHYTSESTRPLQSQLRRSLKRRAVGGSMKKGFRGKVGVSCVRE